MVIPISSDQNQIDRQSSVDVLRTELAKIEPTKRKRIVEKFVLAALGSILPSKTHLCYPDGSISRSFFMSTPNKLFILVDGSSYLYRAFHAMPRLTNSQGQPTGAVYGLINMIKSLLNEYQPEHMAVVFDAKGKTFRDELYPAYKATREAMPEELVGQLHFIHEAIRALGLPLLMVEGVEADDVIGTLAAHASQEQKDTLISTGDKDLAQLVNPHVTLINTMTNTQMDREGVVQKFGVPPERIVDYLALIGDTSDNIPGVAQVGPKTAAKWLTEYGSLDNLIQQASNLSSKAGENFRASLSQLPLTRSLVTIKQDIPLNLSWDALKIKPQDRPALIALFKELEFKTWLAELLEPSEESPQEKKAHYTLITTREKWQQWLKQLQKAEHFAFYLQTAHEHDADLTGIALALRDQHAYLPLRHNLPDAPTQLEASLILHDLQPFLENPHIEKITHDAKLAYKIFEKEKISLPATIFFDTLMEAYLLDSSASTHDLNSLALKYLGRRSVLWQEVTGKGSRQISFHQVSLDQACLFAAEKAELIWHLHQTLWQRLTPLTGVKHVLENIEMPLSPVLARMEACGVLIDPDLLKKQGRELQKKVHELEQEAFSLAGEQFNINSPKQLQEILFHKLKLPILQKTATGQASTADAVLQELALNFALPSIIIAYRSLNKLITTYTNPLVEQMHVQTRRIHTTYNQAGTSTGRLSSSDPNLQNIPVKTAEGRRIRQAFIAPPGYKLISADYSQIELRIMADVSQDANLLKAFSNNIDIHTATAAEVAETSLAEVTPEMRRQAKAINFGLLYGMSAFGLARQLGIEQKAATEYIERYFSRYPGVKAYMDNTREHAKEKGYVETLWGRRLYVPDIRSQQHARQKAAERIAINAPLQGSAADIIKMAMINIDQWIRTDHVRARMILQVHDELVFEAADQDIPLIIERIRQEMTEVVHLSVPLQVAIGVGNNWDEASSH